MTGCIIFVMGVAFSYFVAHSSWIYAGISAIITVGLLWTYSNTRIKVKHGDVNSDIMKKCAWIYVNADKYIPDKQARVQVRRLISEIVYIACKGVNVKEYWVDFLSEYDYKEE
ncbi:MAG: hypothetical protein J6U54_01780 [Clostridiales bacterium]|nr:hypothetical protein [Clostridiales bacterium]